MSNSFSVRDAAFDVGVNVRVRKLDKRTGRELERREGHNRCLKMQLMGITKFLNGEYNNSQPQLEYYDWIPRYLAVGTNLGSSSSSGVTTEVSINDTKLFHEISPRMKLPERNKIINRSTQNYIQLVIVTYLPEELYNDEFIREAGLFSKETGNNCLFRIVFDEIHKTLDSVIEINWTITVISLESSGAAYSEIDKTDLREAMNELLDLFAQKYPDLKSACDIIKSPRYI